MTKTEFTKKFDSAYRFAMESADTDDLVEKIMIPLTDKNGKISQENVSKSVLKLSLTLNERILRSVLSEFLDIEN